MVGRRGGLSGKQKATLLKSKAAQKRASGTTAHSTDGTASGGGRAAAPAPRVVQQKSRMGHVNQLSTAFLREEDGAGAARRLAASLPLRTEMRGQPLVASPTTDEGSLGMPLRPPWHGRQNDADAQEAAEQAHFDAWLAKVRGA